MTGSQSNCYSVLFKSDPQPYLTGTSSWNTHNSVLFQRNHSIQREDPPLKGPILVKVTPNPPNKNDGQLLLTLQLASIFYCLLLPAKITI